MRSETEDQGEHLSLAAGGPFHFCLRRFGLLGEDQLPLWRASIGLALAVWLLPAVLVVAQTLIDGGYSGWGYFTDLTVYARFLIAIAVMIATERHANGRLNLLARQFSAARIVAEDGLPAFRVALANTDRRSSSTVAEVALAVVALVWSGLTTRFSVELAVSSWEGKAASGGIEISWAGFAVAFVSNPLFLFLVLRWFWRFLLWAQLLFRISRLPLQLSPLHPDRSAGLGFLAIYPSIFGGFVFALSCVISSSLLKDLSLVEHDPRMIWFAMAGWLVICLALFLGPLLVFARPLFLARERALLEYGSLAHQHHLAFDLKWMRRNRGGEELLGQSDPSSVADLNASVEVVEAMHIFPVDRSAVVGLLMAAGLPMLAVVGTQIPLIDLVKWIAGAVF